MSQGLIQGSMREAPLPDIIQLVSQGGKTGCFHVADEHRKARIFLKDGRIVHAVTNECVGLDAVYEVALWLDGHYHFEENAPGADVTITKPNPSILMEMHRRMDEWRVISQKIPSLDLHPHSTLLPGEAPSGVNPREARLLALVTGYYTVAELAEVLDKPVLNIAKDLYGLVMAGHVVLKGVRSGKRPEGPGQAAPERPANVRVEPPIQAAPEPVQPEPVQPKPVQPGPVQPEPVQPEPVQPEPVQPEPVHPEPIQAVPVPAEAVVVEPVRVEPVEPVPTQSWVPVPEPVHFTPRALPRPLPPAQDPIRLAKLTNFTQRIVTTAKNALPHEHHEMVQRLQARANQQLIAGEGPEAVKNLALAVSKGAVEAGCDAETIKHLNANLKALFAK